MRIYSHFMPIVVICSFAVLIIMAFLTISPTFTGKASINVSGGTIYRITLNENATYWFGIYGNLVSNGTANYSFSGGTVININLTYDNITNETMVAASLEPSPDWSNISFANHSDINAVIGLNDSHKFSSNSTFTNLTNFTIRNITYELLTAITLSGTGLYRTGAALSHNNNLMFVTQIQLNKTGFTGDPIHYQMILPVNSSINYSFIVFEPSEEPFLCNFNVNLTARVADDNNSIFLEWDPIPKTADYEVAYVDGPLNGTLDFTNSTNVSTSIVTNWTDTSNASERYYKIYVTSGGTTCIDNGTVGAVALNLSPDYNLITQPFDMINRSVEETLRSIDGSYSSVNEFNNDAKAYNFYTIVGSSIFKNFDNITPGNGYWVRATANDTLKLAGSLAQNITMNVSPDYNLLGFPVINNSASNDSVQYLLGSIDSNYSSVNEFDNIAKAYNFYTIVGSSIFKNFNELKPGRGYWVRATANDTVVYQNG